MVSVDVSIESTWHEINVKNCIAIVAMQNEFSIAFLYGRLLVIWGVKAPCSGRLYFLYFSTQLIEISGQC